MLAVAEALRRWNSGVEPHLLSARRRSSLARSAPWTSAATGLADAAASATKLAARLRDAVPAHPIAVFLEDVPEFAMSIESQLVGSLTDLVKLCREEDL